MDTFQLSCFLAVAETLNFARAAEQLNVTQPAITHQIHSLEKELNVKLFKRTTRTVSMTDAGTIFLNDAQHMVAISERAKKRFADPYKRERQIFSVGCHSYIHLFLLSEVLREMAKEYLNLHPRLKVVPFQHLYRLLDEDDVDVVVGFQESDSRKIRGYYKEIKKVPLVCICSRESHLATKRIIKVGELEQEKLVLFDPITTPVSIAKSQGKIIEGKLPSDFYFGDSIEAVTVLVNAGFGVSILPDIFLPPDGSLLRIPIEGIEPISFGVYYKTLKGNMLLKSFMEIMKEQFKGEKGKK